MPKRYRVTQDIPGIDGAIIRAGSELTQDYDRYKHATTESTFDHRVVETNPTFFAPLPDEQEAPYPWEPKHGDTYCYVNDEDVVIYGKPWVGDREDNYRLRLGNVYRYGEDTCRAAAALRLLHPAVKALLNFEASTSPTHRHVYGPDNGGNTPVGITDCDNKECKGVRADSQAGAQAIANLFNWFLTNTPHE